MSSFKTFKPLLQADAKQAMRIKTGVLRAELVT